MSASYNGIPDEMRAADVLTLYRAMDQLGIPIWIDGGWCVDALLGKQTRPHSDLDIALEQRHVTEAIGYLAAKGYREIKRDSAWNFEMADDAGHKVDFHAFVLDAEGTLVEGIRYPEGSLTGTGTIDRTSVRCIAPAFMMSRTGYDLRDTDVQDVRALCEKFGDLIKVRRSARIVVLHPAGAVLLVHYTDLTPIDPSKPELLRYWVPPGGEVEEGESYEEAATRELEEETGIDLTEVGPQIWSRQRQLMHRCELKTYLERYFVAWAESPGQLRNRTLEKIEEIRWWTLDELRASSETFLPEGFVQLVAPILGGTLPSAPIEIL